MNALKRLSLGVLLALSLVFSGAQRAAATPVDRPANATVVADVTQQCYDVYQYSGTWYGADGSVIDVYRYIGTWCPAEQ